MRTNENHTAESFINGSCMFHEGALARPLARGILEALINDAERAYGKSPHPSDLDRHRKEFESFARQLVEITQMFDYGNAFAEQNGVRRSRQIGDVIYVVRIDSYQSRAVISEKLGRIFGEEWVHAVKI